ncbi:hypothetical protein BaRGS_00029177 [Batillaria attramentaria]|uniref:Uncharacterized protein n=1 Tax=Batillaria attramentaria TaxID=370345 RepID=A0ABD0JXC9_9CAEN
MVLKRLLPLWIYLINVTETADILNCLWRSEDFPECEVEPGYVLVGDVTDILVLQIPSANEEHVGTYACEPIPSKKDTSTEFPDPDENDTSTEFPDPDENDNNTTVYVAVAIVVGVLLTTGLAFLVYKCRDKELRWACENDKDVAVRLLLQLGANVEADVHGLRPLHVASKRGNEKIVQILLDHHANINAEDPDKQKPSSIAKSYDHKKLIPLLKEAERKPKGGVFRL